MKQMRKIGNSLKMLLTVMMAMMVSIHLWSPIAQAMRIDTKANGVFVNVFVLCLCLW